MVIWLTGLSGSGKSTIAYALANKLPNSFVLDGDEVRKGLNKDLGFTAKDRAENIRRIGELAKLLGELKEYIIVSAISPFAKDREAAKAIIGEDNFIEVYVYAPISLCEARDPKGLYKLVREGKIGQFTGISSPYEIPQSPSVILDTLNCNVEQCVEKLMVVLDVA